MLLPSDPSFRITVRDLTKSYGDSLVLDHVSLDLESGCPWRTAPFLLFSRRTACLRDTPPSRISASSPAAGILPMN